MRGKSFEIDGEFFIVESHNFDRIIHVKIKS